MAYIYFWFNSNDIKITTSYSTLLNRQSEPDSKTWVNLNNYACTDRFTSSEEHPVREYKSDNFRFIYTGTEQNLTKMHVFYSTSSNGTTATITDITEYIRIGRYSNTSFTISGLSYVPTTIIPDTGDFMRFIIYPNYDKTPDYVYTVSDLSNCTCNKSTGDEVKANDEIIITANNGYKFDPNTSYKLKRSGSTKFFTVSNDKSKLTYTTTVVGNITISGITANKSESKTYVYNISGLSNCTCDKTNGDTITKGDTITITANSGYEFNPDSNYTLTVGTTTRSFAVSEDKTKLTFTDVQGDNDITITNISPDKIATPNVYTVTENLTNVTGADSNPVTVTEGDTFTLSYTANEGYTISTATANIGTVTISDDKKSVTITGTATENIIVTVSSFVLPTYTIRTLTHCTANKSTGDVVNSGDVLTITAETGYYFNAVSYTLTVDNVSKQFVISDDKTVLTYTIATAGNVRTQAEIIATLIPSSTVGAFLHLYNVTIDELNEIAKNRFYTFDNGEYLDYGKDILKLYRCYVPIKQDIQSRATIQIGDIDTTITSTEISDDVITVETDIVTSGLQYNNDYTAELFIPNNPNIIHIPIEHAFNKTVHIKLSYELYDGVCQYVLTDNGVIFDNGTFNFASDIPFRGYDNVSIYEYNYNPPIYKYAVLVITGKATVNISDITTEYMNGTLTEFSNNTITDNDYSELLQIFTDGVYIN